MERRTTILKQKCLKQNGQIVEDFEYFSEQMFNDIHHHNAVDHLIALIKSKFIGVST